MISWKRSDASTGSRRVKDALTLRAIADRMNKAGYLSLSGKPFDGMVIANLLRPEKQISKKA